MTQQVVEFLRTAYTRHPRRFEAYTYVYPVLSRRSKGISIGINLNPDKICNFDCIYCQVDRTIPPTLRDVSLPVIDRELRDILTGVRDGSFFERPPFLNIPAHLQRLNDIAFSGDGEPTSYPRFREVVERVIATKEEIGFADVKIVVITNASLFHRPQVREAFRLLDRHNGEIWAKLDAGTEDYYRLIERTTIPFQRIVQNITHAAKERPLIIQSLFMRVSGEGPPSEEIEAYCGILRRVLDGGGSLKLIQVYTVARPPAEASVTTLTDQEVDGIAERVREWLPNVPVEVYY
ncbi:MAG: radical SAM protein [Candidatus Latescibacteria bacterium]|nr:radical SAM protein [Candidatus Latescibacterota bacterium]